MNKHQRQLLELIADPVRFISKLKIINKEGKLVQLIPNGEQIKIIQALEEGTDTLVLKGRQIGSSTIVSAYLFWKAYTSTEPLTIAILSHKLASSKHLLKIHKTFYDHLPPFLKRRLSVDNTTELTFGDSGAGIIAVSAEGKGGLRSFTCSYLHISEYAFAPNPDELKATALSALNNGQLIIESTANHFNDALHQEITRYERGDAKWNYLFFRWFDHELYREDLPEDQIEWTPVELELKDNYDLDDEQLYWRKLKLSKIGNLHKFQREFPATIEDAYSISGNVYLSREDFEEIEIINVEPREASVFDEPDPNDRYAVGVDVSAGVGRDYSVIYIISKTTHQPVLHWRSNECSPVYLAERIMDFATEYNNALVLVESNNFGNVVLNELNHLGYNKIWKTKEGKDWITTSKSKTAMFENLKDKIQQGYVHYIDNIAYAELRAITISDRGMIELPTMEGAHADNSVALSLAYVCLDKIKLKEVPYLPHWIKSRQAQRVISRGGVAIANKRRY
jgi:hypothetical protein